jgi:hypothetical protein
MKMLAQTLGGSSSIRDASIPYKVALPDQTEVWVRGVDLLGLKAKK